MLEDVKGQLLSGITIKLDTSNINPMLMDVLDEHIASSAEDRRPLSFTVFDPEINRTVKLASNRSIPLNRDLTTKLESMDIEFTIER